MYYLMITRRKKERQINKLQNILILNGGSLGVPCWRFYRQERYPESSLGIYGEYTL